VAYRQIPYAIEQGIISVEQGIYPAEQGNFGSGLTARFVLLGDFAILIGRTAAVHEESNIATSVGGARSDARFLARAF